jgi:hypothetical protein
MWLKPENRCLVPANSLAEYGPEPNPETKKKDVVWFARVRTAWQKCADFGSLCSTARRHGLIGNGPGNRLPSVAPEVPEARAPACAALRIVRFIVVSLRPAFEVTY